MAQLPLCGQVCGLNAFMPGAHGDLFVHFDPPVPSPPGLLLRLRKRGASSSKPIAKQKGRKRWGTRAVEASSSADSRLLD